MSAAPITRRKARRLRTCLLCRHALISYGTRRCLVLDAEVEQYTAQDCPHWSPDTSPADWWELGGREA